MVDEAKAKKKYLGESLDIHISSFAKKRSYNRRLSIWQHSAIVLTGAIITILSGLRIELGDDAVFDLDLITKNITLFLGAITTIIGAYKAFFNNDTIWLKYTMTCNNLKKVKSEFEYYLEGKKDGEIEITRLDEFKNKIQKILDETNNDWESLRLKITQH
ncbi:DUF4231 domain-containing protein [Flagellimonas sp. 389]|uniref:DUF4231 domain-containing protein n=1 Tax=Flagellimonas sp. 389 TaxID=2835862 RepID=UPI001BD23342|nr:DUF4231 domain-containing protein [Flagellimonas sp. 389]MBS9462881.1 DUF4231 domain-containing protein [Flagellimonas sp. 389]